MPEFAKSEFFVPEPDNWHLLPGAPESVRKEFEEYMEQDRKASEQNIIID